jgi:hypothetical protein
MKAVRGGCMLQHNSGFILLIVSITFMKLEVADGMEDGVYAPVI